MQTETLKQVRDAHAAIEAARTVLRDSIVAARANGDAVPAIAEAAGVTRQRVYQILREAQPERDVLEAQPFWYQKRAGLISAEVESISVGE